MNPELLLVHFSRISGAPDAIPRLRQFVLELAARGKLADRDPKDEPASEILNCVQAEKDRRVREGQMKEQGPLPEVRPDEIWFDIPVSWCWARLATITQVLMGQSPPGASYNKTGQGIPLINGPVEFTEGPFGKTVINQYTTAPTNLCEKDDLLLCVRGSTIGRTNIAGFRACIGRGVAAIRPLFADQYVRLFIWRQRASIIAMGRGTMAFQSVRRKQIEELPVPLPPLAEQHRIVTKVDELMVLCDRLEKAQEERESRRDRLVAASLHRLNHADEKSKAQAFREDSHFYLRQLPRLTTHPESVKKLRQSILNLAVSGLIASRDPAEESAAARLLLNDQLRQEKGREDHRAEVDRQPLLAAEDRWSVPSSWEWCALADLVLFIDYRGKTPNKVEKGVRLLTAKNVKKGFINVWPEEFLSEPNYHSWMTRGLPKEGDVLFTTEAPMGNAAVIRLSERFALAQRVICFRPYGALDPDFLVLQLISEPFQAILEKTATGLTAKGIKAAKLKRLPIAVPPLAEQRRIMAKVDELITICEQLEAQLTTTQNESRRLLGSVLYHALNDGVEVELQP